MCWCAAQSSEQGRSQRPKSVGDVVLQMQTAARHALFLLSFQYCCHGDADNGPSIRPSPHTLIQTLSNGTGRSGPFILCGHLPTCPPL